MIFDAGTIYIHEPVVLKDGDYLIGQGKDVTVICFVPTPKKPPPVLTPPRRVK